MLIVLAIICSYALAAAAVHAASRFAPKREPKTEHFVLIAENHQSQIEWYLRMLQKHEERSGKSVRVTLVSRGSKDDTVAIARLFARSGMNISIQDEVSFPVKAGAPESSARSNGTDTALEADTPPNERPRLKPRSKWQRFRIRLGGRPAAAGSVKAENGVNRSKAGQTGTADEEKDSAQQPTHLYWMTPPEASADCERAVLVDLRDPGHLSKLPL
ncbi:hypothetical protein [Paenibacillus humicola]|uniref:hypothetical protein n=1 Tax=Paenibacillus humicola TaxID=3110540 RepID=UPI00237A1681|nr:hypothetical protein [Paenibacillus humicola]